MLNKAMKMMDLMRDNMCEINKKHISKRGLYGDPT